MPLDSTPFDDYIDQSLLPRVSTHKITHNWHTQDSNPSPFIIRKYSQPIELILFHVINPSIKCHKGSHYSHLLNNYLFNYLNFLGLTITHSIRLVSLMIMCVISTQSDIYLYLCFNCCL